MKTAAMQILGILLAACILFKETMATGNFDPINTICSETPIKDHFHYWDFTGKVDPMTPQNSCDLGPNNAIYEEIEIAVGILGLGLKEGSLKKSGNNIVELVDTFPSSPHRMNNKYCALNLQNDYVDFGAFQTECFGNIALCTSGLTVAIWLKINLTENPDTGSANYVLNTGTHDPAGRGFSVSLDYTPDPKLIIEALPELDTNNLKHLKYEVAFPDNEWFQLTCVYDAGSKAMTIYINGVQATADDNMFVEAKVTMDPAIGVFLVGTKYVNPVDVGNNMAAFTVSDLFVYQTSFTLNEVRDLHECQDPSAFDTTLAPVVPTTPVSAIVLFGQVLTDGESNVVVLQETMLGDLKAITDVHGPAYTLEEIEIVANTLNIVLPVAALDDTVAQSFLEVSSDVIGTLTVNGDDQQIVEFITGRFMHLLEEFAEAVAIAHDCDSGPSILDTEFVDLKVDCIDPESTEDQTFSLTDADVGYSVSITVPNTENDIQLKVSLMVYDEIQNLISNKAENKSDATQSKNLVLEPVLEKDVTVESLVTSFIITSSLGTIVDFTNNPVVISLKNNEIPPGKTSLCGHWVFYHDGKSGMWSESGCTVDEENSSNTYLTCICTHLTNFAVLMQVTEFEIPLTRAHSLALENLTYICSVTSIFCLVMTLGCYTYLRLWKSQRIILHANLAASLAIAQTIYLVGIEAEPASLCKVVAVALHYFFTSSFVWMFIEGANLYVKSIFVFAKEIPTAALAGVGWGVPLLIVAISLAIRFDGYGSNGICWLSYDNGLIWAFAGPVILVILINAIILILVLRVFMTLKANADKTEVEKLRIGIRAIVMLQPLLGLTWLFGAFAVNAETLVFQYLFIIFNALQGVFIFILHCAMNEDVKQAFLKKRRVKHSHDSATMSLSMRDTSSTMATKSGVESVKF